MLMNIKIEENHLLRFYKYIKKSDDCWTWIGGNIRGYGIFNVNGKSYRANRLSYYIHFGAFDKSTHVLHRCDNPYCVRPSHLYLGTHKENMKDMQDKGRRVSAGTYKNKGLQAPSTMTTRSVSGEIRNREIEDLLNRYDPSVWIKPEPAT